MYILTKTYVYPNCTLLIAHCTLFVVFAVGGYLESTVNLFTKHNSCKLVRKGHFRHGKTHDGEIFDVLGKSPRASYDKCKSACKSEISLANFSEDFCLPSMHMEMTLAFLGIFEIIL